MYTEQGPKLSTECPMLCGYVIGDYPFSGLSPTGGIPIRGTALVSIWKCVALVLLW